MQFWGLTDFLAISRPIMYWSMMPFPLHW